MAQKIADFLQVHKVSSHAIAMALLGFFGLYTSNQGFADSVNQIVGHYPKIIGALTVAAGIYLRYSASQKHP